MHSSVSNMRSDDKSQGSGFIGSNLVEELLELGYKVRVLDNLVTGSWFYTSYL